MIKNRAFHKSDVKSHCPSKASLYIKNYLTLIAMLAHNEQAPLKYTLHIDVDDEVFKVPKDRNGTVLLICRFHKLEQIYKKNCHGFDGRPYF